MASVTFSFSLDQEKYGLVIAWLDSQERRKRSEAIAEALQSHLDQNSVTLGDVYQAVKALERKLHSGAALARSPAAPDDALEEPPDVAANLDSLGL